MSWYYAENNERRGPVDEVAFDGLVRASVIKPATLVWREGMPNWVPFAQAGYVPPAPAGGAPNPSTGEEMGVCSESGKILPRSELVEIEGRLVSAEYKNVVLQRIREGVSATGAAQDPEAMAQAIAERGWSLSAGDVLSRGWGVVKSRFWLTCGSTFLVQMVIGAAGIIPVFGPLLVQGPLMGGLFWLMLKIIRGEHAGVEDAFQGFQRNFGHLIGVTFVTMLVSIVCLVPGFSVLMAGIAANPEGMHPMSIAGFGLMLLGLLAMAYFNISWIFATILVVDRRFEFWPAMKLSRRVVGMHWWQVFWLLFLVGLVVMGILLIGILIMGLFTFLLTTIAGQEMGAILGVSFGVLGMIVLIFTLMPLGMSTLAVAYEDIFGEKR